MRKSYIGWWIAAGFFLLCGVTSANAGSYYGDNSFSVGLFGLLAIVLFFSGYSRYKAYKEYQQDRAIRNQFYESQKQSVPDDPTQYVRVTHSGYEGTKTADGGPAETPEAKPDSTAEILRKAREAREAAEKEREQKREGTVMREFSVAGVSLHQDVIRNAGYLNDEYSLSVKRLEEDGLLYDDIPKYLFDGFSLSLELEPDNEVDPNAVKVLLNDEHVGYIPADDAEYVHDMMEADRIADMDGRIVGGPLKRYDEEEEKMEKVDLSFGIRIDLYIRKGR